MSGHLEIPEGWVPDFPGQRPPFAPGNQWRAKPGNELSMKHGVNSPRRVEPIARQVVKELRAVPELDWLHAPRFKDLLWAYARQVARRQLLEAYLATLTMEQATDSEGGKVSMMDLSRQLSVRESNLAERLGILPYVPDDVRAEIAAARKTLARRAEREKLQRDLRESLAQQWFGESRHDEGDSR